MNSWYELWGKRHQDSPDSFVCLRYTKQAAEEAVDQLKHRWPGGIWIREAYRDKDYKAHTKEENSEKSSDSSESKRRTGYLARMDEAARSLDRSGRTF